METNQIVLRLRNLRDTIERETGEQLDLDSVVLLADVCRVLNLTSGQALYVIGVENKHSKQVLPYQQIRSQENLPQTTRAHSQSHIIV